MEHEFEQQPYMWNAMCEAAESIEYGFYEYEYAKCTTYEEDSDQYSCDFPDWEDEHDEIVYSLNVLGKKVQRSIKKNPQFFAKAQAMSLMSQQHTAAVEEQSRFDAGAAATGFGLGFAGVLAGAFLTKMCHAKASAKAVQSQECLL